MRKGNNVAIEFKAWDKIPRLENEKYFITEKIDGTNAQICIGEDGLFAKKRKTLMLNGYEAQVGQLYAGMDLKKFF
mgnify:CR=1 FL=1